MIKDTCTSCGAQLTKKELLTREIDSAAVCDICMGKQMREAMAKLSYSNKMKSVPVVYSNTRFEDKSLDAYYRKSAVIIAELSPVAASQWMWDMIKYYWKRGHAATYVSMKTIDMDYATIPWQDKKEYVGRYIEMPGMLGIDDVSLNSQKDILSRIIEYRAERDMDTMVAIYMKADDFDRVAGDKADMLVKSKWKYLTMERK